MCGEILWTQRKLHHFWDICWYAPLLRDREIFLCWTLPEKYGWKDSRRLIAWICIGYAIVQTLCTLPLCGLAQLFLPMLEVLKYIGGIYMVWLAIHIMRSRYSDSETNNKPSFHLGLLLQLVNVKIYFYISTLLTAYFIPNCKSVCSLALAEAPIVLQTGAIPFLLSMAFLIYTHTHSDIPQPQT